MAEDGNEDILVAFVSTGHLEAAELASIVDQEVEERLAPDEMIIVGPEPIHDETVAALRSSRLLNRMRQRLADRTTIRVVGFNASGEGTRSDLVCTSQTDSQVSLEEIRRRGATAIFRLHGGFVESTASYHFRNPSKRHTSRFIRLSNILVCHAEISFIAFCLMPHVPSDARIAYVDTPSMFTVVSALNQHLRATDQSRPTLIADSFRSYEGLATYKFTDLPNAVALVSASTSGSLAVRLTERGFATNRIIHTLFLGANPSAVIAAIDLSLDSERNPDGYGTERETYREGECKFCDNHSVAINLQGDQFDIAGPQPEPLVIKNKSGPESLMQTMSRLAGSNVFSVGFSGTKHQYAVDPTQLHLSSEFRRRLEYSVHRHVPAGVEHMVLVDDISEEFGRDVSAMAGIAPKLWRRDEVHDLHEWVKAGGVIRGAVLVVAVVVESGRVMLDVSRDLRMICPAAPIVYLVGLAKQEAPERRETLVKTLAMTKQPVPHLLTIVEELILPAASTANAWTAELALLNRLAASGTPLPPLLADRHTRLLKSSDLLTNDLFLANGDVPLGLTMGFVFWNEKTSERPHTQADIFFTISSVLQQLRANSGKDGAPALRTNWFQQTLLDPSNFGRYNDGVIQACLLRAGRPAELDYASDSRIGTEAARVIRRIIENPQRPKGEAAVEFLMAIATRRLRLARDDAERVLAPINQPFPLMDELLEISRIEVGLTA